MDCAPEAYALERFTPCWGKIDLVSKLRWLLPGKETRSAEENLEDRRRMLLGFKPGAAECQQRGTWLRGCVLPIWISSLPFNDRLHGLATGVFLRRFFWIGFVKGELVNLSCIRVSGTKLQERRWKRLNLGSRSCPSMKIDWPKLWGRAFASNSNFRKTFQTSEGPCSSSILS